MTVPLDMLPAVSLWAVGRAGTEATVDCVLALESWAEVGAGDGDGMNSGPMVGHEAGVMQLTPLGY